MWSDISSSYAIRNVAPGAVTTAAEQGIVAMLEAKYQDPFSLLLTPSENGALTSDLTGQRNGSIGVELVEACGGDTPCSAASTASGLVFESVLTAQPAQ